MIGWIYYKSEVIKKIREHPEIRMAQNLLINVITKIWKNTAKFLIA